MLKGIRRELRRPQIGLWQLLKVNISVDFVFCYICYTYRKPVNYKINITIGDENIFGQLLFQKHYSTASVVDWNFQSRIGHELNGIIIFSLV